MRLNSIRKSGTAHAEKDAVHDGALVGAEGPFHGKSLAEMKPFVPEDGAKANGKTCLVFNGIGTPVARLAGELQRVANATGFTTYGLYNATRGPVLDSKDVVADKWSQLRKNQRPTRSKPTLAGVAHVLQELRAGRDLHLIAHSHGALIASNALSRVEQTLIAEGKRELLRHLSVESYGGVSTDWPATDLIRYDHGVNKADPFVMTLGLGRPGPSRKRHEGSISSFTEMVWRPAYEGENPPSHGWTVYLRHRHPYDL